MEQDKLRQSEDSHDIPITSIWPGKGREVAEDLYYNTNYAKKLK